MLDALSLTRERVRGVGFWEPELTKIEQYSEKERHPLPSLSHGKMGEGISQNLTHHQPGAWPSVQVWVNFKSAIFHPLGVRISRSV